MKGVANALDILEGDQYLFMGALLATLVALMRQIHSLFVFKFCGSLVDTLKIAVITRSVSHCFFAKFTLCLLWADYASTTFVVCSTMPHHTHENLHIF